MKPQIGSEVAPLRMESVSAADMKDWARILCDANPIHLDPNAVAAKGLGDRVINQGPANLAYIITMLQKAFPAARIVSLEARYIDNVYGGDCVEAGGRVVSVSPEDPALVTLDVWLNVQSRGPAVQGSATLKLA